MAECQQHLHRWHCRRGLGFTEYARSTLPFFLIEAEYEGDNTNSCGVRVQAYHAVLSGAMGHFYGNNPVWHFNAPTWPAPAGVTWQQSLNSNFNSRVSTYPAVQISGASSPALSSDARLAMIRTTVTALSVNMAALPPTRVRTRCFDTVRGTCAAAGAGNYANSGTVAFTPAAESVLVIDPA